MANRDSWIWIDPDRFPDRQTSRYTGVWGNTADNDTVVEFSKSVNVGGGISHIDLRYSADAAVQLWINGRFIGTGPVLIGGDFLANDRPRGNRYATELTVVSGENDYINKRIAVSGLRDGRVEILARVRLTPVQICEFSVGRGGFMLDGHIHLDDGREVRICTDESWCAELCPSYYVPMKYDGTLAKINAGAPVVIDDVWHLQPSPLPLRVERRLSHPSGKATVMPGESVSYDVEYDKIYAGFLSVTSWGAARLQVEIDCLETDRDTVGKHDSLILFGNDEYLSTLMYGIGLIRVCVTNMSDSIATIDVAINEAYLPSCTEARVTTDVEWINKVLDVARHTLKYCRQYIHLDSPKHCEPSACTGDYYIESMMSSFSYADMALADFDVVRTARILEHNNGEMFHPTYSLIWVRMLLDVYMRCGRIGLLEDCRHALAMLIERFSGYVGKDGIIDTPPNYMFVDWIVVDGFSLHHPPKALGQSVINMFYYDALSAAAEIYSYLSDEDAAHLMNEKREKLRLAINEHLYDKERGMYFEGLNTPTPCEYLGNYMPQNTEKRYYRINANALAVAFGVIEGDEASELMRRILNSGEYEDYQPYFAHFVLSAVHRAGLDGQYLMPILEKWRIPVEECDKGLAEGFIPPEPTYVFDHSHAWGGTPLYSLPMAITSLRILEPGMRRIAISPKSLGLGYAYVEIPTPKGTVTCEINGENTHISSPNGIEVIIE